MSRVGSRDRLGPLVGALVALPLLAGCGGPGDTAFDAVCDFACEADRIPSYTSWDELQDFATSGRGGVALVVASAVEASGGAAFTWSDNGMERTQLPIGSEEAMVRTVHLVAEVDRVLGDPGLEVAPGQRLVVGFTVGEDADPGDVADSLDDLPPSLFFLHRSAVFDYEDDLVGVLDDGLLVAVPDGDGELSFPALPFDDPLQPPDGTTLDSMVS